jgi:hypothetical protein
MLQMPKDAEGKLVVVTIVLIIVFLSALGISGW